MNVGVVKAVAAVVFDVNRYKVQGTRSSLAPTVAVGDAMAAVVFLHANRCMLQGCAVPGNGEFVRHLGARVLMCCAEPLSWNYGVPFVMLQNRVPPCGPQSGVTLILTASFLKHSHISLSPPKPPLIYPPSSTPIPALTLDCPPNNSVST